MSDTDSDMNVDMNEMGSSSDIDEDSDGLNVSDIISDVVHNMDKKRFLHNDRDHF